MVALVLADAALEKFGGDSLAETRRNAARLPAIAAEHGHWAREIPVGRRARVLYPGPS